MTADLLLPRPRTVDLTGPSFAAGRLVLCDVPPALAALRDGAQAALDRARSAGPTVEVAVAREDGPEQGYGLELAPAGVTLAAADPHGLLYGSRTLARLLELERGRLPAGRVEDAPHLPRRGVFVESSRGADRMTLEDWKELVDSLARLNLNLLAISLYGCWDRRYGDEASEFLFARIAGFPQLRSERRVATEDGELRFTPPMFEERFLGDVVTHARAAGIHVIPWFGGPGHSTLIPRAYPALSAKDRDGGPTGYGYCTSAPEARRLLERLVAGLADEHVVAHGLSELGLGADEFYPIPNLDPGAPGRLVSPVCACPGCRSRSAGEQLLEYLTLAGEVLAERGVRALHWHDSLVREGVLERYAERVEAGGLPPPTVAWWGYRHPLPRPRPAFDSWVTPTTGTAGSLFVEDHSLNIAEWLREADCCGASGVMAYTAPSPAFERNYACLADLAWRGDGPGVVADFKRRWSALLCPARSADAEHAFAVSDSLLGCHPLVVHLLDHLLPYFGRAPGTAYPRDLLAPLGATTPALTTLLTQVQAGVERALELMPSEAPALTELDGTLDRWRAEQERISGHVELVLELVEVARTAGDMDAGERERALAAFEDRARAFLHRLRPPATYQAPYVIREHHHLLRDARAAVAAVVTDERLRPAPAPAFHPWPF